LRSRNPGLSRPGPAVFEQDPVLGDLNVKNKESTDEEDPKLEFKAKYVELNPLGKGGCGSVFNGYRKSDKLVVAIKHIPNENIYCTHFDESGRELSVEVAVMLKLQSGTSNSAGSKAPITLLDWYVLPHELILVLERPMPASDLHSYIERRGGSLKESEAKMILKQLVEAAIHLQDEKIFHRDIKLENILIEMCSGTPRVRIIDFGLSCFTEKNSTHKTFCGTDRYIPPEWLSQYKYSAGPTTVWQLGIVLFECLHNKNFSTSSYMKRQIKMDNRLSKDCKDFLRKCCTRDPKERPITGFAARQTQMLEVSNEFIFWCGLWTVTLPVYQELVTETRCRTSRTRLTVNAGAPSMILAGGGEAEGGHMNFPERA
uniref:non-specific serine/threonine protein kinase n=1 Tax=Oryzias latipes TaxID=8090 RepID=A0A3P9I375_ORYLA